MELWFHLDFSNFDGMNIFSSLWTADIEIKKKNIPIQEPRKNYKKGISRLNIFILFRN